MNIGAFEHDKETARAFLHSLDSTTERFTFQMIPDAGSHAPKLVHGTLDEIWPTVLALNVPAHGLGVFVTINETDFRGRKASNIIRVRALFGDADHQRQLESCRTGIKSTGLMPSFTVETSPGRAHIYWVVGDVNLQEFSALQERLISIMGTDPSVKDLPRIMRLPGTLHLKDQTQPRAVKLRKSGQAKPYSAEEVKTSIGFKTSRCQSYPMREFAVASSASPAFASHEPNPNYDELGGGILTDLAAIESALAAIPLSELAKEFVWTRVAMGLADEARLYKSQAQQIWNLFDAASRGAANYDAADNPRRWHRFLSKPANPTNRITIASVFDLARQHGWSARRPEPQATSSENGSSSRERFRAIFEKDFAELPEPKFLVEDFIPDRGVAVLYGPTRSFKTYIALDVSLSVAAGLPVFGSLKCEQGAVVYAAGEAPHALARSRVPAWKVAKGMGNSELPFALISEVPAVGSAKDVNDFIAAIQRAHIQPRLVVIDTVARAMAGLDENHPRDGGLLVAAAEKIGRELACAMLLLAHPGKDEQKGMRGSSAIPAGVDAIFKVKRSGDTLAVTISCEKMKDADEPHSIHLLGQASGESLVFMPVSATAHAQMVRSNPPLDPAEVIKALKSVGATGGKTVSTAQLVETMVPVQPDRQSALDNMRKRLTRGAKQQLMALVDPSSNVSKNGYRWTSP